jgi:hypothetical protein
LIASFVDALAGSSDFVKILNTDDCPKPIFDFAKSQISSAAVFCVIP